MFHHVYTSGGGGNKHVKGSSVRDSADRQMDRWTEADKSTQILLIHEERKAEK